MGSVKGREPQPEGQPEGQPRPEIAGRVLAYFRRNAEAMDSAEGIARFWIREDRDVVERCLTDLHSRGLLERRLIGGTAFYSCHHDPGRPDSGRTDFDRTGGAAALPARTGQPASESGTESAGRILVVDDDRSVREFLMSTLAAEGHQVVAAEGGQRGIELFRDGAFDLVITDVRMPGTTGLELLRTIKRQSPDVEVIVVTAHASLDTAIEALRDGAYDLITKPLPDIEALFRVVRRALEKRRLSDDNRRLVRSLHGRNVELTQTVARLAAVNEIGKATAGLLDVGDLYGSLVRLVAQHLQARRVSVLVSGPDSDLLTLIASVGIPEEEGTTFSLRVGEGIAGRVAASQAPLLVQDIGKSDLKSMRTGARYSTPSFMITPLTVSYPIRYQRKRIGVINVSDKHSGEPFDERDLEFLSTLASQMAVAIENARLVKEMEDGYQGTLVALIQAMEDLGPETRGHSRRVAELCAAVARGLGLPGERVDLVVRAAALHELGRVAARPAEADLPPGGPREDADRYAATVAAAARMLAPITSLRKVREIILRSAEWFDPASHPIDPDGAGIPIESRILASCEELVALCADAGGAARPAGGAGSDALALQELRSRTGRRHDAEVEAALARAIAERDVPGGPR
jgi:response regulator RpfG family c-di-GMP phosphodiesterase